MKNGYMPIKSTILDIIQHTDIEYTFRMEYTGDVKPGQFFEVSIPKYGECPISVSGIGEGYIDLTIRRVGKVTDELHNFTVGSGFFIRGPYGNGFDMNDYKGKNLLVVAGGSGLAPVKGIIDNVYASTDEYNEFKLIVGFKSPEDVLFKSELNNWIANDKMDIILTVDKATEGYEGNVGLVTKYIDEIDSIDENTEVVVVGPPMMMKFSVMALLAKGVAEDKIWVSYERKMHCGIGKCGHCKMDDTYICLDGPVFNYSKAKNLFD